MSFQNKFKLQNEQLSLQEQVAQENLTQLFVQNIPHDLTKEGLINTFSAAGPITAAKVIPSQNLEHQTTFGFVTFKTKASAMKAMEMFNNYKLGNSYLKVKFAKPLGNNNTVQVKNGTSSKPFGSDLDNSADESEYRSVSVRSVDSRFQRTQNGNMSGDDDMYSKPAGRGQLHSTIRQRVSEVSRPFARRLLTRRNSQASQQSLQSDLQIRQKASNAGSEYQASARNLHSRHSSIADSRKSDVGVYQDVLDRTARNRLKIGEAYEIEIRYVANPSCFYIQTKDSIQKTGELLNNMDNCYRNEDFAQNDNENFEIGDLYACFIDSYWFRGELIGKKDDNCYVRLIDFGDSYEIPRRQIRKLKKEFLKVECNLFKCALAGIKPYNNVAWSQNAIELIKNFSQTDASKNPDAYEQLQTEKLLARIVDYDYDKEGNEVCLVHLLLSDESNSVIDFMLDMKYAEKCKEKEKYSMDIHSVSTQNLAKDLIIKSTINDESHIDTYYNYEAESTFYNENRHQNDTPAAHQLPVYMNDDYIYRDKLHNCSFLIFKVRDLVPIKHFGCGQTHQVRISCIYDTKRFYVQLLKELKNIEKLQEFLQNYANKLLSDIDVHYLLFNFMLYTTKFDVVLAKSSTDKQWKRAVILDRETMEIDLTDDDEPDFALEPKSINYFKVLFIDSGEEELITYKTCLDNFKETSVENLIVILPMNHKLTTLIPFALKCELNLKEIKRNYLYDDSSDADSAAYFNQFEIEFRKLLSNNSDELSIKILQVDNFRNDTEAFVDLLLSSGEFSDFLINCVQLIASKLAPNNELTTVKLDPINKCVIEKSQHGYNRSNQRPDSLNSLLREHVEEVVEVKQITTKAIHSSEIITSNETTTCVKTIDVVETSTSVKSVSKELIKPNVDKIQSPPNYVQLLSSGEQYEVCFMHVLNFKKLFFCMISQLETLESIQSHLNTDQFLSRTLEVNNTSAVACGELVVCFFEEDENWYRAIVLEALPNANQAKVFFVDYGNEITCSLHLIRKIDNSQMNNKDDYLIREPYKINCCELNINENILKYLADKNDESVNDKLKNTLQGEEKLYAKVLHAHLDEITNLSKYKSAKIENCLPKYLISLYMTEDETESDRKLFHMLDLAKIEKALQKPKVLADVKEAKEKEPSAPKLQFLKLDKDKVYKATLQYLDSENSYIYFGLKDNIELLNSLQNKLQEDNVEDSECTYLKTLAHISVGQQLEALYSDDERWYRVVVTEKSAQYLEIFFADFGNSEKVTQGDLTEKNCLRERVFLRSATNEDSLLNIDYQAIRCAYRQLKNENLFQDFVSIFENESDDGFLSIRVIDLIDDNNGGFVFVFDLAEAAAGEEDREVSQIFEQSQVEKEKKLQEEALKVILYSNEDLSNELVNLNLPISGSFPVSIVNHDNVCEFYVQLNDSLPSSIRIHQIIQIIMSSIVKNGLVKFGDSSFEVGDYVLAKSTFDLTWNRGIVLAKSSDAYEILFVDYGSRDMLTSDVIMSIFDLNALLKNHLSSYEEVRSVIEFPFQAVLCHLGDNVKASTLNKEILKMLINDYIGFHMKVVKKSRKMLCDPEANPSGVNYLNRYMIELYADEELLNERFETFKVQIEQNVLRCDEFYTCRISFVEKFDEFFVHLDQNMELLEAIENYLNQAENRDHFKRFSTQLPPKIGDFVVAKFDDKWYRARVFQCDYDAHLYEIFFLDYGNVEKNVSIEDLRQFAFDNEQMISYEICNLSAMAYLIDLHQVKIDIHADEVVLSEIMELETFSIRISQAFNSSFYNMGKYSVEFYDNSHQKCFNYYFANMLSAIEMYNQSELTLGDTVNAEFTFTEGLDTPIYFCIENDVPKREKLDNDLMNFYTKNAENAELNIKISEIQANLFYAFFHTDMWFRVLIESVDHKANKVKIFFVDYGESMQTELSLLSSENFKQLHKKFYSLNRYAFPISLCDLSEDLNEVVLNQRMDTYPEFDKFIEIIQKYVAQGEDGLEKKLVKMKINSVIENQNVEQKNDFMLYLVEITNENNESLNKELKIEYLNSKKAKKYLQFKFEELPKQVTLDKTTNYRTYAKRIDCFFLFNEEVVAQIQEHVFELCSQLISSNMGALDSLENKPTCGDLVLGKSGDDDEWYRCLITNHSDNFDRYEVVFIDFGNTEILPSNDILAPVEEKHLEIFANYASQAFACKLYPFVGPFDEKKNTCFKDIVSDRLLRAEVILRNEIIAQSIGDNNSEDIYMSLLPVHDVHLLVVTDNNNVELNVQDYLIQNKIVAYESFCNILNTITKPEEFKFYEEKWNEAKARVCK